MTVKPLYRRVLLKASGEALMGEQHFGIDVSVVDRIASDIAEARALGVEVGVVIGGGNIFRGVAVASKGGDRVTGDHMGMLATVINSLALRTSLNKIGVEAVVLSAIAMPELCESFSQRQATAYMNQGKVVIFAGGTGNPFFTTDSAAALRAASIASKPCTRWPPRSSRSAMFAPMRPRPIIPMSMTMSRFGSRDSRMLHASG